MVVESDQAKSEAVCVAVHCRPLIDSEREQGCSTCLSVVPGQPQVRILTISIGKIGSFVDLIKFIWATIH